VFRDLTKNEVGQIWAEALTRWRLGEPLYLTGDIERAATEAQEDHREMSAKEGPVIDYINKPVPANWQDMNLDQRRMHISGSVIDKREEPVLRDRVCALEVWCELFLGDLKGMKYTDAVEINAALDKAPGWINPKKPAYFGYCGKQRGRERVEH
jgi:hypothetical protein